MLIMPQSKVDFQGLAENIASDFFEQGVALSEGISKCAKERKLTPEEVRRLTEKSNTQASLRQLRSDGDRKAVFRLADYRDVLLKTHPGESASAEQARVYQGIPEKTELRSEPELAKAASAPEEIDGLKAIFSIRQELDERKLKKLALEQEVSNAIDSLASDFYRHDAPDFAKFAAESQALFGSHALPVLEGLARYLRVPLTKEAEQDFGVINDTEPNLRTMRKIVSGLSQLVKQASEIEALEKLQALLWQGIKRAAR